MDYGALLTRALNIVWENKFLILLGVLVVLSSSGNSGVASRADIDISRPFSGFETPRPPDRDEFPDLPRMPDREEFFRGLPVGIPAAMVILVIALIIFLGIPLWILSVISRGGLIAGASTLDAGGESSFGQAFRAGWQKGWRLIGIDILPAIPGFLLAILAVVSLMGYLGIAQVDGRGVPPASANVVTAALIGLVCVLVFIALALGLLRTFADRACVLEDAGVFEAYKRGFSVLMDNFGAALILFLIQIVVGLGIGLAAIVPTIVFAFCCLTWPLLLLFQGAIEAYFSTLWTMAWRRWTGQGASQEVYGE